MDSRNRNKNSEQKREGDNAASSYNIINYNNKNFISDPNKLVPYNILDKSPYTDWCLDNTFTVFNSINNDNILIYGKKNLSIECYDLNNNIIITTIKNIHIKDISTIRHYFDNNKKRDLILTGDPEANCTKLWNFYNWELLLEINNVYNNGKMCSVCLFNDRKINKNYIITSSRGENEYIKIWNMNSSIEKQINDSSNDKTSFIDTYYDEINNKNYIINGNDRFFKSFNYDNNQLYQIYHDRESNSTHVSGIIVNDEGLIKLIESSYDSSLRVWNFNSGEMLIKLFGVYDLDGICFWNNNFILASGEGETIKLFDIKNRKLAKSFKDEISRVKSLKKFYLPNLGECLISQSNSKIIILKIKN